MNTAMEEAWEGLEIAVWRVSSLLDGLEPKDAEAMRTVIDAKIKVRVLWVQIHSLEEEIGEIIGG